LLGQCQAPHDGSICSENWIRHRGVTARDEDVPTCVSDRLVRQWLAYPTVWRRAAVWPCHPCGAIRGGADRRPRVIVPGEDEALSSAVADRHCAAELHRGTGSKSFLAKFFESRGRELIFSNQKVRWYSRT
jgi:hypothetical protein